MDYFKFLYPKGTSAAQDMAICIHLAALDMSLSSGARHRGDTDTENLRRLLSCRYQLEVPPDHVGLFLSVSGTDKIREGPAAAAAKAAVKAAKAVEKAAEAARKEAVKAAKKAAKDPATMTEQQKEGRSRTEEEGGAGRQDEEAEGGARRSQESSGHHVDGAAEGRSRTEEEGGARRLDGTAEGRMAGPGNNPVQGFRT
jgi:hypothetical protein